jgi:hypothetical protein
MGLWAGTFDFPPPFCGGGAERSEAKGVAALSTILRRHSHPFRQALRACHLPRKAGEEKSDDSASLRENFFYQCFANLLATKAIGGPKVSMLAMRFAIQK